MASHLAILPPEGRIANDEAHTPFHLGRGPGGRHRVGACEAYPAADPRRWQADAVRPDGAELPRRKPAAAVSKQGEP